MLTIEVQGQEVNVIYSFFEGYIDGWFADVEMIFSRMDVLKIESAIYMQEMQNQIVERYNRGSEYA